MIPAINLQNIVFAYPDKPAIWNDLSFTLNKGQRVGIYGANGSGKTTLFNIIMGLIKPVSGKVVLNGVECSNEKLFVAQRPGLGYVFQNPDDQLFCTTVFDELAFGPFNMGQKSQQVRETVTQTLELFALSQYEQSIVYNLSGGEKRIISLAAVWTMSPATLLLDEPTLSLDDHWLQVFKDILQNSDKGWLMSSHEMDFLKETCHEIWEVKAGHLIK